MGAEVKVVVALPVCWLEQFYLRFYTAQTRAASGPGTAGNFLGLGSECCISLG